MEVIERLFLDRIEVRRADPPILHRIKSSVSVLSNKAIAALTRLDQTQLGAQATLDLILCPFFIKHRFFHRANPQSLRIICEQRRQIPQLSGGSHLLLAFKNIDNRPDKRRKVGYVSRSDDIAIDYHLGVDNYSAGVFKIYGNRRP